MKPRAQGSAMESWGHECAGVKYGDLNEVVVEEGVDAEDDLIEAMICGALHRVCQAQGHIGDKHYKRTPHYATHNLQRTKYTLQTSYADTCVAGLADGFL
jgi:hypothetical protein